MKNIFIILLRFYKFMVSPLLGNHCRFHPSCSVYMRKAIETHGIIKGGFMGLWRILRCNPWHRAPMMDPVPERID